LGILAVASPSVDQLVGKVQLPARNPYFCPSPNDCPMHNTKLSIGQTAQAITIEPHAIIAQGGPESPTLIIPFTIAFTPVRGNSEATNTFIVSNISAQLYLTKDNFRVSQAQILTNWFVYQHNPYPASFAFPLTAEQLFYIEKHRAGDLPASLLITVQAAMQESLPATQKGGYSPTFIRGIETSQAHQYFAIPQSQWVNTVLPKLGYHSGTLLELPPASIVLPKEYDLARQEILQAHKYFNAGDYDKTVGHCRSAFDSIRPDFPNDKPGEQSKTRVAWLRQQEPDTYEYIKTILHANQSLGNKAHHARNAPSTGNFGRNEAIVILGISSHLIAYFGTIIPDGPLPAPTPIV
jgi:hypothetical protein